MAVVFFAAFTHQVKLAIAQEGKIVPYVPTPQEVVDRMLELAEVKKGDVVYDLGSGTAESSSPRQKNMVLKRLDSKSTRSASRSPMRISRRPVSRTWSKFGNRIFEPWICPQPPF